MASNDRVDKMIAQAQRALSCPVCHRQWSRDELKLRGMLEQHGIIQAMCSDKHAPAVVIFIADGKAPSRKKQQPLTTNDVLELHRTLKRFNGDFRKFLS